MKYKEAPWYIPLIFMGAGLVAIVTMPKATGHAIHNVLSGTGQAITAAFGGEPGTPPQPVSLRLPSPQDGPPPTWNN